MMTTFKTKILTTQDCHPVTLTVSLVYKIKTEDVYKDFIKEKDMFNFSNYSAKPKYYDDSNKLVVDKLKDKTAGVAMKKLAEPKQRFIC